MVLLQTTYPGIVEEEAVVGEPDVQLLVDLWGEVVDVLLVIVGV